jgi:glycosyltransferase involved in cell wall biosynthesis
VALEVKILITANSAWNLFNFRSSLITSLISAGHEVMACSPKDAHVHKLQQLGCDFVELSMDSRGVNPVRDLWILVQFTFLFYLNRPDVLLSYTVKPNIYGSIAAKFLGVEVINNISGLGFAFIKEGWITKVVKFLYKFSLFSSKKVFFQNKDDLNLFVAQGIVKLSQADLIPGSGVNLHRFSSEKIPCSHYSGPLSKKPFCFLLVARMLKDKGIEEFVQAATQLHSKFPLVEFALLGPLDAQNITAITKTQIQTWLNQGFVSYWGNSADVRGEIARADCVVLPSYREGAPRSLIEAAAMGRPLIATDVPGCTEVVRDGYNGRLCKPRDANDLALKMSEVLELSQETFDEWGINSRSLAEQNFDEQFVIKKYLQAIDSLR